MRLSFAAFCSLAMRVLNVAEKNDVAKNVSAILSKGTCRKREGLSQYNKIYEFEADVLNGRNQMIMTSVSGHLLEYAFVGTYKNWKSCCPLSLFNAPMEKTCIPDKENIKKTLEREVRSCNALIIWTDCDREGENIGFEIIRVCQHVKPNLTVYRARFSDLTAQAIWRACRTLGPVNKQISDAVDVRQELDLRIGAAFTRFQTLRLQKVFPQALADALVSYGSCQFPTLGFVVERFKQVQSFVPESFWKLSVNLEHEDDKVEFLWRRVRLFDHTACLVLHHVCLENPTATVVDVQSKPKSKWRPTALDTVEFEKFACRKLHMNAKEAMAIAERLYTRGFISYPRTETNQFPKEINLRALVEQHTNDRQWGEFANRVLEWGPNPRQGKKTDNAHPPIHPTKYVDNLEGNEQRIYEFVVRHFLACVSKDAEGQETVVEIDVAQERFVAQGLVIFARNYLDVYPYENWKAKTIPAFEIGQSFEPSSISMTNGQTKAPSLLSEADLIALMDKHGIGTDATHAEHIEKIKQRLYVCLTNAKHFTPGDLGLGLVEGYDAMGFAMSKPHLRAELEADLKRICEGTKQPQIVLAEQIAKYRSVFEETMRQAMKLDEALSTYFGQGQIVTEADTLPQDVVPVTKCPNCNLDLVLRTKKNGTSCYISCVGFPQCKVVLWLPECIDNIEVADACSRCGPNTKKLKFRFKPGPMALLYPDTCIACLNGCDPGFLSALNIPPIRSLVSRTASSNTNRNNISNSNYNPNPPLRTKFNQPARGVTSRSSSARGAQSNQTKEKKKRAPKRKEPDVSHQPPEVSCHCNEPAVLLTVKKPGPTNGKQFYTCSKPQATKCNFFSWKDVNNENQKSRKTKKTQSREEVKCDCSIPAKICLVQKAGPNQGRNFYACSKFGAERCKFFKWEDEESTENKKTKPRISKCGICGSTGHNKKTCPRKKE